jgi:hypothetical protein
MKQSSITIEGNTSGQTDFGNLIISLRSTSTASGCVAVIGHPGLPNVVEKMHNGDAVLFETPEDGILEIRAIRVGNLEAEFLITQISPRSGFAGGFISDDPNNSPFSEAERIHIKDSISELKAELRQTGNFTGEQLELVNRKLDDIQSASERLGRKDWINYTAGTLTSLCIAAAFAPDVTRRIFESLNSAFSWVFTHGPVLLQF